LAEDPEAAYYQSIEEFFVSRRGDPLFLSNADWLLVRQWRKDEIPLRVVLRGIGDALDGHAHSWGRHRKVGSLAYCASEVEAARDRWRRALDLGGEPGVDVGRGLARIRESLRRASGLGPRASAIATRIARELAERRAPLFSEVEPWLAAAEEELVKAVAEEDGALEVAAVEAEVESLLAPYRGRMPERVLRQIRQESRSRRLLDRHDLPRLSLFHVEGLDAGVEGEPRGGRTA
jgi:hypothetical protein